MAETIDVADVLSAMERVSVRLIDMRDELNRLDAAIGDGDAGITVAKGAAGLQKFLESDPPTGDLGKLFFEAGRAVNRKASSTLGTLAATALMRAGKEARELKELNPPTLARMLTAANEGVQERGGASPGDKTIVDALDPASEAFSAAIEQGEDLETASEFMLEAARAGHQAAIPLRSKVGRAAWVGERTENKPDPGTALFVAVLEVILNVEPEDRDM